MKSKPIFNKRLYKAQAGITISKQANEILHRNPNYPRSENDLRAIRSVVAGLKDIHKNFEFVKSALGHAVTYEMHESNERIEKSEEETQMSCYYILSGSVEAFYSVKNNSSPFRKSEERSISYTHVSGDYIGLLSADGSNFDIPPPESMSTIGDSEFLSIDRFIFHEKIQEAQKIFRDEIVSFLDGNVLFEKITQDDREKLVSQMVKQEFPAGKQILSQGQKQKHAFFVAEGRCVYYRRLYLPEQKRSELFKMGFIEKGSYFDATCIIDDQSSRFSVSAVGPVMCYSLNKWTIQNSESLLRALNVNRPAYPSDKEIEILVKESDQWQSYKRDAVCDAFALKRKATPKLIPQNAIPKTLDTAIKQGAVLRQQRQKELVTSWTDELDPSRRKSRGSSAHVDETTEGSRTKSVLKVVMIMKRSRSSIQIDGRDAKSFKANLNIDQKSEIKSSSSLKRAGIKSAPNFKHRSSENFKIHRSSTATGRLNKNKQKCPNNLNNRSKLFYQRYSTNQVKNNRVSHETSYKNNNGTQLEAPTEDRPCTSPSPCMETMHKTPRSKFNDHWVANDKKFKVKEIVNTRIPRKEIQMNAYRRFEPSMFEYLDKMNTFEKEEAVDPFAAKLKARAWLKQAKKRLAARGSEYNPGQSPIIVIEEFCADDEAQSDEEIEYESRDQKKEKSKVNSGSMEILLEDSDKENAAQEVKKHEWTTAIHETRYEAECCLEQAKTDIAILERQLVQLGWTRDMLNEKERKRNEARKRSTKHKKEKTEEKIEEDETEMRPHEIERKRTRTIKREDSIRKILEDHSKRFNRRHRSDSEEKPDQKRRPTLVKRYSSDGVPSDERKNSLSRPRIMKAKTFTIS